MYGELCVSYTFVHFINTFYYVVNQIKKSVLNIALFAIWSMLVIFQSCVFLTVKG